MPRTLHQSEWLLLAYSFDFILVSTLKPYIELQTKYIDVPDVNRNQMHVPGYRVVATFWSGEGKTIQNSPLSNISVTMMHHGRNFPC